MESGNSKVKSTTRNLKKIIGSRIEKIRKNSAIEAVQDLPDTRHTSDFQSTSSINLKGERGIVDERSADHHESTGGNVEVESPMKADSRGFLPPNPFSLDKRKNRTRELKISEVIYSDEPKKKIKLLSVEEMEKIEKKFENLLLDLGFEGNTLDVLRNTLSIEKKLELMTLSSLQKEKNESVRRKTKVGIDFQKLDEMMSNRTLVTSTLSKDELKYCLVKVLDELEMHKGPKRDILMTNPRRWANIVDQYMSLSKEFEFARGGSKNLNANSSKIDADELKIPFESDNIGSGDIYQTPKQFAVFFSDKNIPLRTLNRILSEFKARLVRYDPKFIQSFVSTSLSHMISHPSGYHGMASLEICLLRVISAKKKRLERVSLNEGAPEKDERSEMSLRGGYSAVALEDKLSKDIIDCIRIIIKNRVGLLSVVSVSSMLIPSILYFLYTTDVTLGDPLKSERAKRIHLSLRISSVKLLDSLIGQVDIAWKSLLDSVQTFSRSKIQKERWRPLILSMIDPFICFDNIAKEQIQSVVSLKDIPDSSSMWSYREAVISLLTTIALRASYRDRKSFLNEFHFEGCLEEVIKCLSELTQSKEYLKSLTRYNKLKNKLLGSHYLYRSRHKSWSYQEYIGKIQNSVSPYLDSEKFDSLFRSLLEGLFTYFTHFSDYANESILSAGKGQQLFLYALIHIENTFKSISYLMIHLTSIIKSNSKDNVVDVISANNVLLKDISERTKGHDIGQKYNEISESTNKLAKEVLDKLEAIKPDRKQISEQSESVKKIWEDVRDLEKTYKEIDNYKEKLETAISAKKLPFLETLKNIGKAKGGIPTEYNDIPIYEHPARVESSNTEVFKDFASEDFERRKLSEKLDPPGKSRSNDALFDKKSRVPLSVIELSGSHFEEKHDDSLHLTPEKPHHPVGDKPKVGASPFSATKEMEVPYVPKITSAIPPPPPPFDKKNEADFHTKQSVASGLIKSSPDTPLDIFVKEKIEYIESLGDVQLKNLRWEKLGKNKIHATLWNEVRDLNKEKFNLNEVVRVDDLIKHFKIEKPVKKIAENRPSPNIKPSQQASGSVTLIDTKRSQNISIMLSGMKCTIDDLIRAIVTIDDEVLDVEKLASLKYLVPTEDEFNSVLTYNGDMSLLDTAEMYILKVSSVPKLQIRLNMMHSRRKFSSEVRELDYDADVVTLVCRHIKSSERLKLILAVILSIGNIVNNSTFRGCANGFKIKSLMNLRNTTSNLSRGDACSTLLHYLAKLLCESVDPMCINFVDEIPRLNDSTDINVVSLVKTVSELKRELDEANNAIENIDDITVKTDEYGNDTFKELMPKFFKGASVVLSGLIHRSEEALNAFHDLLDYFGEEYDDWKNAPEEFFGTFVYFSRDLKAAHDENLANERKMNNLNTPKTTKTVSHLEGPRDSTPVVNKVYKRLSQLKDKIPDLEALTLPQTSVKLKDEKEEHSDGGSSAGDIPTSSKLSPENEYREPLDKAGALGYINRKYNDDTCSALKATLLAAVISSSDESDESTSDEYGDSVGGSYDEDYSGSDTSDENREAGEEEQT